MQKLRRLGCVWPGQRFVDGLHPGLGASHKHHGRDADQTEVREVGLAVVLDGGVEQPRDRHLAARAEQQGGSRRAQHSPPLRADGATGTADVFHHHRSAQALGQGGAMVRATRSTLPPAGYPTTSVMGLAAGRPLGERSSGGQQARGQGGGTQAGWRYGGTTASSGLLGG